MDNLPMQSNSFSIPLSSVVRFSPQEYIPFDLVQVGKHQLHIYRTRPSPCCSRNQKNNLLLKEIPMSANYEFCFALNFMK